MNTLYLGDNLPILKNIESESVDLIYIDPPFNSNRNYSGAIKSKDSVQSAGSSNSTVLAQFEDTWKGGMKTYIHEFMYPIVQELHRILKPTGSFYLHCDSTAQAYIQVELLDPIFGVRNWKNQIIWSYQRWTAGDKNFQRCHDMIFLYAKDVNKCVFNLQTEPYSENSQHKGKRFTKFENGKAVQTYTAETREKAMRDVWELSILNSQAKERTGYPTQKPEKLLERIVLASSNEGDVVLDCFLGSGTTIAVANKLGRKWIGIDQSAVSLSVCQNRLKAQETLFESGQNYQTITAKWDYDVLRKMDDFEFEKLMVSKLTGTPSKATKGGDMGIDGIVNSKTVISIKRSDSIGRNVLDNLMTATKRHRRDFKNTDNAKENYVIKIQKGEINLSDYDAVVVAFSFGKGTYSEQVDMRVQDNFNILLLTVEDILPVAKPPKIKLVAVDNSELLGYWSFECQTKSNIENYSWIIKNHLGEIVDQEALSPENNYNKALKKGNYKISVSAVDSDGLSASDELSVIVN